MKFKKNIIYPLIISTVFSLNFMGCSYLKKQMEESEISKKSEEILLDSKDKINQNKIYKEKLPIYEEEFEIKKIENSTILSYHSRNMDVEILGKTLKEQLAGYVEEISILPSTNQILVRTKNKDSLTTNSLENIAQKEIMELIRNIDKKSSQIMVDTQIIKIFADHTRDISAYLKIGSKDLDNLLPNSEVDLKGAILRYPERAELGERVGIIGELGSYLLEAKIDQLESRGYAKELARPVITVENGKKARISLKTEVPFMEEVLSGGAILKVIKYKPVENYVEIIPDARDNQEIFLNLKAGVGTISPYGHLQVPSVTTRETVIEGVTLKQGETLVVAGFINEKESGVERKGPLLSKIPLLGELFRGEEKEQSRDTILFLVKPNYIDINQTDKNF